MSVVAPNFVAVIYLLAMAPTYLTRLYYVRLGLRSEPIITSS